jgi:flagellar hook-associated protein 3 FlgL
MRLSFNQTYAVNVAAIGKAQERLQMASAKLEKQARILTPADDPSGAARVAALDQQIDSTGQFQVNSNMLSNSLNVEETVLRSIQSSMLQAKTLVISLGNGSNSQTEREAIASQLANVRAEIYDLMNQRDSNGGYLFSGFNEKTQSYEYNESTGYYDFKGDEGQKFLQVSTSVTIAANDSGKNIFETVEARNKPINVAVGGGITQAKVEVSSQSIFDGFYTQKYDGVTAANNDYRVSFTAPDQYAITLQSGAPLAPPVAGTVLPGQAVNFNGLKIDNSGTFPGQIDFSLKPPSKSNVLNTLTDVVNAVLRDKLQPEQLKEVLIDTTVQLERASLKVGETVSALGGRQNLITSISGSLEDLKLANVEYRADIYELDLVQGITELTKQETQLQVVQSTFTKVTQLSLFDYIR